MNLSLFKSWYSVLALLGIAAAIACSLVAGDIADVRWLRLATGWLAGSSMALALGYVLRKYMHKYGYSPEFKLKVPIAQLERAEMRLNELRGKILTRAVASRAEIAAEVKRILSEERVQRVLAVDVKPGPSGGAAFVLEVNKAFLFGRAAKWLHLHLYISIAFAAFVLAHGGRSLGLDFGGALFVLSALVVVTGVIGIALWALGPTWLTRRERDLSIEESFVLHQGFQGKLQELRGTLAAEPELAALLDDVMRSGADAPARTKAALQAASQHPEERRRMLEDACVLFGQMRRVEREFRALWRIRLTFMAWRAVHIPAAVLLSAAVLVHVVSVLRY